MDPRLESAVRRARHGDPRAFRLLAEHLGPELTRYLTLFLGGDTHAANDVVQETLVAAWDALPELRGLTHLRRWCYRVARCKAISWLRKQRPPGTSVNSLDAPDAKGTRRVEPAARDGLPAELDGLDRELHRAIRSLPPRYAGPIHLHYVQGCSTQETAELLGLTRATVKMRLHRARALLRRALAPYADAPRPPTSSERRTPP